MVEVKVLLVGKHEKVPEGTYANSTITLIRAGEKNILVDAGSFGDKENLIESLGKEGLSPDDIHTVVVTHLHLDHTANLDLFRNADIVTKHSPVSSGLVFHGSNNIVSRVDVENLEIVPGVKTILTPGHVEAHISVVAVTSDGTYVICGDAIQKSNQIDIHVKPEKVWNLEAFENSRKLILEVADYVVPGHGGVVQIKKKSNQSPKRNNL
ncbi:MAG: MBL fold metallo-hydrolase [Candidatus Peribacteraceae bacterium]|jgi:glyoxylase-like metal-dependent hydrolase (beta-lactamase superfamily II)|nr:MBL fold metallo-hydrolase [Candidatus Peribacteraceae bacterium]